MNDAAACSVSSSYCVQSHWWRQRANSVSRISINVKKNTWNLKLNCKVDRPHGLIAVMKFWIRRAVTLFTPYAMMTVCRANNVVHTSEQSNSKNVDKWVIFCIIKLLWDRQVWLHYKHWHIMAVKFGLSCLYSSICIEIGYSVLKNRGFWGFLKSRRNLIKTQPQKAPPLTKLRRWSQRAHKPIEYVV